MPQRVEALARRVTDEEIQAYQEHGVVHLRGLLDENWVRRAAAIFQDVMTSPSEGLNDLDMGAIAKVLEAGGAQLVTPVDQEPEGRFWVRTFNWMSFPQLAELGCRGPLPEIAAELLQASRTNFFGDQLFLKEAGSLHRTAFHQDAPYFHLTGDQCCTIWMPLDVVDDQNGVMGYVRGSHRWDIHGANVFVTQAPIPGSVEKPLPDIEGHEDDYDIVYIEAQPGDAIVHHVKTVHGSKGNISTTRARRALALRYLGDDVRYLERQGSPPDSRKSSLLNDGDVMDSPDFPLVWTAEHGYVQ